MNKKTSKKEYMPWGVRVKASDGFGLYVFKTLHDRLSFARAVRKTGIRDIEFFQVEIAKIETVKELSIKHNGKVQA